jgi:hypothetical protein
MGDDWFRDTSLSYSGAASMSFYRFDYLNNENDRTQWTSAYDLSACAACAPTLSFRVYGGAEPGYDGIYAQCSGNGGTSWTDISPLIDGYWSWDLFSYPIPSSCLTTRGRLAFRFSSDVSIVDAGLAVDDVQISGSSTPPKGYLDTATSTSLSGWACDPDAYSQVINVRLAFLRNGSGTPILRTIAAGDSRSDLVTANVCGGTGNHGYTYTYDAELLAALGAGTHTVFAYGIDGPAACGIGLRLLTSAPKSFTR